jgi:hypothetical protein
MRRGAALGVVVAALLPGLAWAGDAPPRIRIDARVRSVEPGAEIPDVVLQARRRHAAPPERSDLRRPQIPEERLLVPRRPPTQEGGTHAPQRPSGSPHGAGVRRPHPETRHAPPGAPAVERPRDAQEREPRARRLMREKHRHGPPPGGAPPTARPDERRY